MIRAPIMPFRQNQRSSKTRHLCIPLASDFEMAVSASRNLLLSCKSTCTRTIAERLCNTTKALSTLHLDRRRHFSQTHARSASILGSLSDNPGAYSKRIRRGRGPASGKGKTSGRGHKGQKQHGKVPAGFNGGETSAEVAQGKRGFVNE